MHNKNDKLKSNSSCRKTARNI